MHPKLLRFRWIAVSLLPVLFLLLFFFYPLAAIFQISLFPEGVPDLSGFVALATRPYLRSLLLFTVAQATLSTALTLLAGLPAAYALARYRFVGQSLVRALLTVPFVLPTVVVATAFLALLGPRGYVSTALMSLFHLDAPPFRLEDSFALILIAHVYYNLTVVIRIVGGFWANLDPTMEEAAAMLGASPARVFREVTLPLLRPAIGAAALLIFLFTFSSFGVILILGGPRFGTLEVEIYRQTVSFFNLPLAAALSLLQMLFTFLLMTLYSRLQARASLPLALRPRVAVQKPLAGWRARLLVLAAVGLPTGLVLAPLLALAGRALVVGGRPSLQNFLLLDEAATRSVLANAPLLAVRNSLLFAALTMLLSLVLGVLGAYALAAPRRGGWRTLLEPFFLLPLGTSAVTLGFGFIVALDQPPLNLRTSVLLVPLAHSLIAFPFVLRVMLPALRSIHPALREAAAMLGASPWERLREIDLALLARPLLVAASFAFAVSLGEFGATSLVQRPEWPTMPVLIFRLLGRPGPDNYGRALAMSTILMTTTLVGFLAIERFRIGDWGEF